MTGLALLPVVRTRAKVVGIFFLAVYSRLWLPSPMLVESRYSLLYSTTSSAHPVLVLIVGFLF